MQLESHKPTLTSLLALAFLAVPVVALGGDDECPSKKAKKEVAKQECTDEKKECSGEGYECPIEKAA